MKRGPREYSSGGPRSIEIELQDRIEKLTLAESSAGVGIWDVDLATSTVRGTSQFFRLMGLTPTDDPVPIDIIRALRLAEDRNRVVNGYREAVENGRDTYETEYRIRRPDGEIRWIFGRGRVVRDSTGTPIRYSGVDIDITERKEAEAARRESELRLKLALEAGELGVWDYDATTDALRTSPELNRILGFAREAAPTLEMVRERYFPGERERIQQEAQDAIAGGNRHFQTEFRYLWPNDELRWLLVRAEIQFSPEALPVGALGVVMDITDRKNAEERQSLLMQELDHRVKNVFAMIQAIAVQTLRGTSDIDASLSVYSARLIALSSAHSVLLGANWRSADLRTLVEAVTAPFKGAEGSQFEIEGPPIALQQKLILTLALILHELCTNAVKYGALSVPTGSILLKWSLRTQDGSRLLLTWRERGGPVVSRPTRAGFGTRLIQQGLANDADVDLHFHSDGVVCTIQTRLDTA
jgi:PAS domain S-box-containing protein